MITQQDIELDNNYWVSASSTILSSNLLIPPLLEEVEEKERLSQLLELNQYEDG